MMASVTSMFRPSSRYAATGIRRIFQSFAVLSSCAIIVMLHMYSQFWNEDITNWSMTCPLGEPAVKRILIVLRVPVDLAETRNFVRTRVGNMTECDMEVVFMFGRFKGPMAAKWQQLILKENSTYGDMIVLPTLYDYQLHDSRAVETLKPLLNSDPCKLYHHIAFGTFGLPDERIQPVTRLKMERENWELDQCLKFTKIKSDNIKFFAHYFPPRTPKLLNNLSKIQNEILHKSFSYQEAVVSPHDFNYITGSANVCSSVNKELFAIFAVHSAPGNFLNRKLIRNSWGSAAVMSQHNSLLIFFLGYKPLSPLNDKQKLEVESFEHNDIIQEDFLDSYKNMTLKQVSVLKFISKYCSDVNYSFLFKTDDDIVIDVKSVINYVNTLPIQGIHLKRTIFCFSLNEISIVPRYQTKWQVLREEFSEDLYPAYCSGAGYLVPKGLVQILYDAALHVETLWVDDTHISGILPEAVGDIQLLQIPKQHPIISHKFSRQNEDITKKMIVHVVQNLELFHEFWEKFQHRHKIST